MPKPENSEGPTSIKVDDVPRRLGNYNRNRSYFIRRSICYYLTSVLKQGGGGGGA